MSERIVRIQRLYQDLLDGGCMARASLLAEPSEESLEEARRYLRLLRDTLEATRMMTEELTKERDNLIGTLRVQRLRKLKMGVISKDAGVNDSTATKRAALAGFDERRTKRGPAAGRGDLAPVPLPRQVQSA